MPFETIRYELHESVATITLNRPERYNALDLQLGRELFHATLEADENRAVRCIVVTGAGKALYRFGAGRSAALRYNGPHEPWQRNRCIGPSP